MARKRYKPEEIVTLLRQAEVLHGQGKIVNGGGNNAPRGAIGRSGRGGAKLRHSWSLVGCGEGQEMYGVELYAAVRLAVVDEGLSAITRRAGGSASTAGR